MYRLFIDMGQFLQLLLLLLVILRHIAAKDVDFQSLYRRIPDNYLKSIPQKVFENVTVADCAQFCAMEVEFECKSFDIDNQNIECHLHNHTHREPLVGLQHALGFDHYRTNYERLFNRIPNHVITMRHNRNIRGLTVEECARRCILEMSFKCQGFDFEVQRRNCWLTDKVAHDVNGLKRRGGTDFYERKTNGALARFINYGHGALQSLEGVQIHGKIVLGVNLDACAQLCLAETSFPCASFDYVFGDQSCQLSQYISANVHGMRTDFEHGHQVMHYELIGEYLVYFYPTPYASVLEHNDRTIRHVTPETCARKCLEEREFVCRSFDYQIRKGTCLLSHVTGSDAGSLYTPEDIHGVHHFEMKPSLDCGGDLQGERGTLASPYWPRRYHHHLNCTWKIEVPDFKIIRLDIYHLDLGWQSEDTCSENNDVLKVFEPLRANNSVICLRNYQTELSTVTNKVHLTFTTNAENDALGFRIFYTADWPCNVTLTRNNGQFASPRWPNLYPARSRCQWRIAAPPGATIMLRFTSVELEDHMASNCRTAYDKIEIYDGNFTTSNYLKTLCGNGEPSLVTSQSNVISVLFVSDSRVQAKGFHASYSFIEKSTTTSTTTSTKKTTTTIPMTLFSKNISENSPTNGNGDILSDVISSKNKSRYSLTNNTNMTQTMKMTSQNDNDATHKIVELTAIFIEPLNDDTVIAENNITHGKDGKTSDDIGRGSLPDVKYDSDNRGRSNHDVTSVIIGVIVAFLSIVIVMSIAIILICRYYRRRLPKLRNGSNLETQEENMSLCHSTRNANSCAREYRDEADVDEAARFPLPGDHAPIPDVEFLNPLYVGPRPGGAKKGQKRNKKASDLAEDDTEAADDSENTEVKHVPKHSVRLDKRTDSTDSEREILLKYTHGGVEDNLIAAGDSQDNVESNPHSVALEDVDLDGNTLTINNDAICSQDSVPATSDVHSGDDSGSLSRIGYMDCFTTV